MGTSRDSKGPGSLSTIVPAHADVDGQGPGPQRDSGSFRAFRTSLGKFVSGGNSQDLKRGLGHYARTSTGGSGHGPRRYGSMARSGGALFDTLSALRDGRDGQAESGVDLSSLNGQDTDLAVEAIADALTPEDGDADRIRIAMLEALSDCLIGKDVFDFAHITDDMLIDVMLKYVAKCVAQEVMLDSRDAFSKVNGTAGHEKAEKALRQLVASVTEKHMEPLLSGKVRTLSGAKIAAVQIRAITEVWAEWEGYEP